MQPYFLPYIGYFQLIAAVDLFVVYDNVKHTKKGWINRNRLLKDGAAATFTLPLRSGSDALDVRERELSAGFDRDRLLRRFEGAYRRAPQFAATFPLLERIVRHPDANLFGYLRHSLVETCRHLGLAAEIRVSSAVPADHSLKNQDRVLALCAATGAGVYVNAAGGTELYSKEAFRARGVDLQFLRSRPFEYPQFGAPFVPWLSIVDVLMFNPLDAVRARVAGGWELT